MLGEIFAPAASTPSTTSPRIAPAPWWQCPTGSGGLTTVRIDPFGNQKPEASACERLVIGRHSFRGVSVFGRADPCHGRQYEGCPVQWNDRDGLSGGGYPVVGTVISADMDLVARAAPGTAPLSPFGSPLWSRDREPQHMAELSGPARVFVPKRGVNVGWVQNYPRKKPSNPAFPQVRELSWWS